METFLPYLASEAFVAMLSPVELCMFTSKEGDGFFLHI